MKVAKQNITAIILAGGKSSRMGQDKALLSYQGTPFIDHTLSAVSGVTDQVIVVSDHPEHQPINATVISDIYPDKGPLGGLYTGLSQSKNALNIILSCDVPKISADLLHFLVDGHDASDLATIATANTKKMPLIGIYAQDCIPICKKLIENDQLKMMSFLDTLSKVKLLEIPKSMLHQLDNINTPDDLQKLQKPVTVHYFGVIAEITGCTKETITISERTIIDLKNQLIQTYPELKTASYSIAQNQKIVQETTSITGEDIALLPPFAGG